MQSKSCCKLQRRAFFQIALIFLKQAFNLIFLALLDLNSFVNLNIY